MGFDSLQAVFDEQVNDLRSAEEQLVKALPKLANAASSDELRKAFEEHLAQTRGHLERINDIISTSGIAATGEVCQGMQGLIEEGSKVIRRERRSDGEGRCPDRRGATGRAL